MKRMQNMYTIMYIFYVKMKLLIAFCIYGGIWLIYYIVRYSWKRFPFCKYLLATVTYPYSVFWEAGRENPPLQIKIWVA